MTAMEMLCTALLQTRQRPIPNGDAVGGKSPPLASDRVGEDNTDELGVDVRSGQVGVVGAKLVDAKQRLPPLKGELNLPSEAVQLGHGGLVGLARGDAGEQKHKARCGQRPR